MIFDNTLYARDEEMDEFGDSGAYGDSLEEDYEEEEEEEEAELPGMIEPAAEPAPPAPAVPRPTGGGGSPKPPRKPAAKKPAKKKPAAKVVRKKPAKKEVTGTIRKIARTTIPRLAATSIKVSAHPQGTSFIVSRRVTVPTMVAPNSSSVSPIAVHRMLRNSGERMSSNARKAAVSMPPQVAARDCSNKIDPVGLAGSRLPPARGFHETS